MNTKDVLSRIGYVRNKSNLSARELSLRMGMSQQYIGKVEGGHIVLTVEKLLQILEICNFPIERFFSENIDEYNENKELENLINSLSNESKQTIIDLMKKLK